MCILFSEWVVMSPPNKSKRNLKETFLHYIGTITLWNTWHKDNTCLYEVATLEHCNENFLASIVSLPSI